MEEVQESVDQLCVGDRAQQETRVSYTTGSEDNHYAQIEKELLAIVYTCDHFDAYIYGRDTVHVETDHKPLESIMLKPLNSAPKRLQRMLLRLQKYNLQVKYKRGEMFLADTLSLLGRSQHL